jgi:hypothetical protein
MNVTDKHGGFVAEVPTGSLWRGPRPDMMGTLVDYDEDPDFKTIVRMAKDILERKRGHYIPEQYPMPRWMWESLQEET